MPAAASASQTRLAHSWALELPAALPFTHVPRLHPAPQMEQLARLQHSAAVWQVEWNLLGSWLAASTEGGEVCMWRPDLSGEWLLLNRIVGRPAEAAA